MTVVAATGASQRTAPSGRIPKGAVHARHRTNLLPAHGGGRRPAARLTQDGLPLGEGGQAALPQDARRPPPLPGGEDPRAGSHAPRGAHRLAPSLGGTGRPAGKDAPGRAGTAPLCLRCRQHRTCPAACAVGAARRAVPACGRQPPTVPPDPPSLVPPRPLQGRSVPPSLTLGPVLPSLRDALRAASPAPGTPALPGRGPAAQPLALLRPQEAAMTAPPAC